MNLRIITIKKLRNVFVVILVFSILSCTPNSDVNKPANLLWNKLGAKTDSLIVFLPGLYDTAKEFEKKQIFSMARKSGIKADMVGVNIHLDHLLEEKVIERLEKDIFNGIDNQGYNNVWLVGVSLGGLNSLLYYRSHTNDICGVVVLAPYLASRALTKELLRAGKLEDWQPSSIQNKVVMEQQLQLLWVWIQEQYFKKNLHTIFIGYGDKDPYVKSNKILAGLLDKQNVTEIAGSHNWKTGRKIWQMQLSSREKTGLLRPCR